MPRIVVVTNPPVFTTGLVAKHCKVAPRTVSKWFDAGRLKGYRIGDDRRIPRNFFIKFLKEYKMPVGDLETVARLIFLSRDAQLGQLMQEAAKPQLLRDIRCVETAFAAGMTNGFNANCVMVDHRTVPATEVAAVESRMRCNEALLPIAITDDEHDPRIDRELYYDILKVPFDPEYSFTRLVSLLEGTAI